MKRGNRKRYFVHRAASIMLVISMFLSNMAFAAEVPEQDKVSTATEAVSDESIENFEYTEEVSSEEASDISDAESDESLEDESDEAEEAAYLTEETSEAESTEETLPLEEESSAYDKVNPDEEETTGSAETTEDMRESDPAGDISDGTHADEETIRSGEAPERTEEKTEADGADPQWEPVYASGENADHSDDREIDSAESDTEASFSDEVTGYDGSGKYQEQDSGTSVTTEEIIVEQEDGSAVISNDYPVTTDETVSFGEPANDAQLITAASGSDGAVATGECGNGITWTVSRINNELVLTITGTGEITDVAWYDYNDDLVHVVMSDGITGWPAGMFSNCSNLVSCELPSDLEVIPAQTFFWCRSLKGITIPDNVSKIESGAFLACSSIESLTLPDELEVIEEQALEGLTSLKSIELPDSVTSIGDMVFENCEALEEVTLSSGLTKISNMAFSGCSSLKQIRIGRNITEIGAYAFSHCDSLTDIFYDGSYQRWTQVTVDSSNEISGLLRFYEPVASISLNQSEWTMDDKTTIAISAQILPDDATTRDITWSCSDDSVLKLEPVAEGETVPVFIGATYTTVIHTPDLVAKGPAFIITGLKPGSAVVTAVSDDTGVLGSCSITVEPLKYSCSVYDDGNKTESQCAVGSAVEIGADPLFKYGYHFQMWEGAENLTFLEGTDRYSHHAVFEMPGKAVSLQAVYELDDGVAAAGTCGENMNWKVSGQGNQLTLTISGTGDMKDYDGWSRPGWYSQKDGIRSAVVESGITGIGTSAFNGLLNLKSISLPDTVTEIRKSAFYYCVSLEDIELPAGITTFPEDMFIGCSSLKSIELPESIETIKGGAFIGCSCDIIYHGTECGFYHNVQLLTALYPDREAIDPACRVVFTEGNGHTLAEKESDLANGEGDVRFECSSCGKGYTFHILAEDGECAISELTESDMNCLTIPQSISGFRVIRIGKSAFNDNDQLTRIELPDGLQGIDTNAFCDCSKLQEIDIPDTVTQIGTFAFGACDNLEKLSLGSGLQKIGSSAFSGCQFEEVILPEGLKSIGYGAFSNCRNLASIRLPESIEEIGHVIFENCVSLQEINIPSSVRGIPENAFKGCSSLKTVSNAEHAYVSDGAFEDCIALTSIRTGLPVGENAFKGCVSLKSAKLAYLQKEESGIGANAFSGCTALEKVELEEGLTYIDTRAFWECDSLKSITIPSTVEGVYSNSVGMRYSAVQDAYLPRSGFTIYGYNNTAAQRYASDNNIPFSVLVLPTVLNQDIASKTIYEGNEHSFVVEASGENLRYQWQYQDAGSTAWKNFKNTTPTLNVTNAPASINGRRYRCVINGDGGQVISSEAILNVLVPTVIVSQPKSTWINAGGTLRFTVVATGENLKYTWWYREATGGKWKKLKTSAATLVIPNIPESINERRYRCQVTGDGGTVYTNNVILHVRPVAITTQPKSQTVGIGNTAKFTVAASGSNLSYQWQYKNAGTSSWGTLKTTTPTLTVSTVPSSINGRQYRCIVKSGSSSVTSSAATLTVVAPTKIVTQPKSQTVKAGATATFSVRASGENLKYQWQYAESGSSTWKNLKSTTSKLTVSKVPASINNRRYRCNVTGDGGTVTSSVVQLHVN